MVVRRLTALADIVCGTEPVGYTRAAITQTQGVCVCITVTRCGPALLVADVFEKHMKDTERVQGCANILEHGSTVRLCIASRTRSNEYRNQPDDMQVSDPRARSTVVGISESQLLESHGRLLFGKCRFAGGFPKVCPRGVIDGTRSRVEVTHRESARLVTNHTEFDGARFIRLTFVWR